MPQPCDQGGHLIQHLPEGWYVCVTCGRAFVERHEITLTAGGSSRPLAPEPQEP